MFMRTIALCAGMAVFASQAMAAMTTRDEVVAAGKTYAGTLDKELAGKTVSLRINGPGDFVYTHVDGTTHKITEIGNAGGAPERNPAMGLKLPSGEEVRFEWISLDVVDMDFWRPGQKDGVRRYQEGNAEAVLLSPDVKPVPAPAPEITQTTTLTEKDRQEAREAVAAVVTPGKYNWLAPDFHTIFTLGQDGSYDEKSTNNGQVLVYGHMVRSGSEICFDLEGGYCFDVSPPDGAGVYTLTRAAKMMNSPGETATPGEKSTLTPIR
jgi:hypothetical protein